MSDAILIAGYYRSGTSALSGTLQRLGVNLHNDAEANEHNPLGFYEIPELIEWDVGVFQHLGVDWTDVRGLPAGWWGRADMAAHFSKLDEILRRRFGASALWGIKHPHLCRLFPIYERAITQAGHKPHVIHICREPWVVAASQHRKNGLARAHALLLWVDYLISAERYARHLPRSWLTYQDLLAHPADQIRRIEQDLGLELSKRVPDGLSEARTFLTGQLNRSEPASQAALFKPLQALVSRVWEAVQARDFAPETWDGFAADCAELTGFLTELGTSPGVIVPGIGGVPKAAVAAGAADPGLRPAERTDEAAKTRLLRLRDAAPTLPSVQVLVAVPPARAHAVNQTLESLRAQWHAPAQVKLISAEPLDIPGYAVINAPEAAGELTRILCAEANAVTGQADYVAILSAGDTLTADAVLRFALEAGRAQADMIYCDEMVQADKGPWVRFKPNWDITRLRHAAYVGDWVWYRADTLSRLGGLDAAQAGAEEYDYQLRLAEANGRVVRLPETLFNRAPLSRRDNIPSTDFGPRAIEMVRRHLERSGLPAVVEQGQHLGLFRHNRVVADPGTSIVLLCDGAEIAAVDRWMNELLSESVLTGRIVLAGAALPAATARYLTAVGEQEATLGEKVLAVPPHADLTASRALQAALALVTTEHVAIVDARAQAVVPAWLNALRARLTDPAVALVGARALVPLTADPKRLTVQGPIVIGADTRLGAGHFSDDPGAGGWLAVDQEASAVAPAVVLAKRASLAGWSMPDLSGDALWIDLCAQLRAAGQKIVWTPDVSFVVAPESVRADPACAHRQGSPAAAFQPWNDFYHHPALSLRGDLLQAEGRLGLLRGAPADPESLLLSGPAETGMALLNAARALRMAGAMEASWVPDFFIPAEIGRRAPTSWVRLNPESEAPAGMSYTAFLTVTPKPEQRAALAGAETLIATSPGLVQQAKKLLPPSRSVALWRPALSRPLWQDLQFGTGLNTHPRVLWIDEGIAPSWLPALINETIGTVAWIVMERQGSQYAGSISRMRVPTDEQGWARDLAALAPHVMIRPADKAVEGDHYPLLLAAAAGCHLLVDERLDMPESLGAVRLPNRVAAWQKAVKTATTELTTTLARGQAARAAALALPSVEEAPPPWMDKAEEAPVSRAAD